ncbi:MAG TPA: heme o synthase [Tepidisphaeraceae bacterium]|nr:heme o synthase [Tepidisphaeraceae bacterium]
MKTSTAEIFEIADASLSTSRVRDYYELTKPRMNFLVVITTMVGFCMASRGQVDWLLLFHTVVGTAMTASCAAVLNQILERRLDLLMPRTADRPVAAGRVGVSEAAIYGIALGILGVGYLLIAVNPLTAMLGLATLALYILVYTPLKRFTSLNTVVGAIPGAIPPLMGFTGASNVITVDAIAVFAILFFWQMPHFLAIAILYKRDYQAAGFKMLPCLEEDLHLTNRMILLYTAALMPVSLLPGLLGMSGVIYLTAAVLLGFGFCCSAITCVSTRTRSDARQLFFASIIYLPLLLGFMMFDKV